MSIFVLSVPYLSAFFFFKSPSESSYMYYSDFKSFWNPGMKAITFINHFPQFLCVHSVRPLNAD